MALENTDRPDLGYGLEEFWLGEPAADAYQRLASGQRDAVCQRGREMAELTIPSVFPPEGHKAGDPLPGNNQSLGAQCVATLASKLLFMAFPPGQPMMRLTPKTQRLQPQIDQDPQLYSKVQLALSTLERAHREKAATIPIASAWVGVLELLLVAGNGLWKHVRLDEPTYHRPDSYVVVRTSTGHPVLSILKQTVLVTTLEPDHQKQIYESTEGLDKKPEWEREADIYHVCRLVTRGGERAWEYWEEYQGTKGEGDAPNEPIVLDGTDLEADYDNPPMWPMWLIPRYGENWGDSYCGRHQGDLFKLEANESAINDGAALAGWALTFVKPGSRTSIKQVQKARNLETLSGSAEDVTTFRTDKSADFNFVTSSVERAARRLGTSFLLFSAARREGERVTADEVARVGQELDQAMGSIYTNLAQGNQRVMLMRFIRLHEESDEELPPIPEGIIDVQVVTGVDAMGRSTDAIALREFASELGAGFGPEEVASILDASDYANRLAAAKGIKPDGLVKGAAQVAAERQQAQQTALGGDIASRAAGPVAGALAQGFMANQGQPQEAAEGPSP